MPWSGSRSGLERVRRHPQTTSRSRIFLVDQIHHHSNQHVLFPRPALSDEQRHGDQGVVGDALGAVVAVKRTVLFQEP